jgi:Flp pilus assembly protein TadG
MDRVERLGRSSRRGTTIVEAAFVLPLLLLVLLGAIEYGWLFFNIQQITNAARQGARFAILPDVSPAQAQAVITELLQKVRLDRCSPTVEVGPDPEGIVVPGYPTRAAVRVRITVPTANLRIVDLNAFAPGLEPETIGATVTMAKEGI